MNGPIAITKVGQLVLARLLVAGEKGITSAELRKGLEPLIGHRWTGAAMSEALEEALNRLGTASLISRSRKGKTERAFITIEGQKQALSVLGLAHLPPRTTWDKLKKTYLAAVALGLPAPLGDTAKRFGGDPGFRGALLKARFDLPLGDVPRLEEALDALAWTLLNVEPGRKFSIKAVQALLFRRALGDDRVLGPKPDPKKEAATLLAREVGARQSGKDELRLAVIRRWLDGENVRPPASRQLPELVESLPPPSSTQNDGPERPHLFDLEVFARRVREAARTSPTGRFGDNKVFVAQVWRALSDDPAIAPMGFDGFKQRLAEANNARLLDLSRADLVEAMDPEEVRLSEVPYLGSTFHFVRF